MLVKNAVLHLVCDLFNYELGVQQKVIEKMFGHELMKPMLPTFLSNLVETKHNHLIDEVIKYGISTHITSGRTTKHNVAKEFLRTLVTITLGFSMNASARMMAKKIRLSRKCVYQSLQQHLQIEDSALDFWIDIKKQQRSIALSVETRVFIIKWWTMETTVSPKQKKIHRKRLGRKQVIEHPTHFLQVSQVRKLLEL
jgi:hypothetical protein